MKYFSNSTKNKKLSAFSLIEVAVVLLIIGILIAGVLASNKLIKKIRLSTARTVTQSSPVSSIQNLYAWFETTSTESIDIVETVDGAKVTNWNDINPQTNTKFILTQSTESEKPTFNEESLNSIPTLTFEGDDSLVSTANFGISNNPDLTIFVVASSAAGVYGPFVNFGSDDDCSFISIGHGSDVNENGEIFIGFQGGSGQNYTHASLGTTSQFAIHAWRRIGSTGSNSQNGNSAFVNGVEQTLVNEGTACDPSITNTTLKVGIDAAGTYFTGEIAEIIIYDRALKSEERLSIQNYLAKKWGIAI